MLHQAPPVKIYVLGDFEVQRGERTLSAQDWSRKKAAALLKRLAVERRLLKDQAIEFLWPEGGIATGANNFYKTLHVLRQTVNAALGEATAEQVFRFEDGILSLVATVWVDAEEFERLCSTPESQPEEARAANLDRALSLYRGDLLPDDRYAEWTLLPRERLRRLQREARLALAPFRHAAHDDPGAISLLAPLLAHDPADEPVHRELMRLYALSGQRHAALRQYQACVEALAAELGVSPAPETTALHSQILNGTLAPAVPVPEIRTASQPPAVAIHTAELAPAAPPLALIEWPRPLFVGRERELAVLLNHLKEASAGRGRVVFVTGEAGQGKTSLIGEFAYRALTSYPDLVAAAGTCQALAGIGDPYLPFRDLLAMLSGDFQRPWLGGEIPAAHAQRLQSAASQTRQAITNYAPDLVDIIAPPAGAQSRAAPSSAVHHMNRRQIFDQMRQVLHTLASHQPVLLLLDDLQWADTASINLLFYLGRQLVNSAVLIVGAFRPSEVMTAGVERTGAHVHPLAEVVQELVRYLGDIRVDLDTVEPAEGRSFVDALLDSEPNRLDATFREALFRRTKGQPLFLVELLRAMQDQGEVVKDASGMWTALAGLDWKVLPARVEAVIARRIDRLPQALRQLLSTASVEGESFTAEVVAQVQEMDLRSILRQLSQELDRGYRLVHEQGEISLGRQPVTRYQFRHNLFQQYLYQQLSPAERRTLHGEIAASLEQLSAGDVSSLAVTLAHHYLEAGRAEKAVPYLCLAGDEARRRVALEEAVRFYESALEHWQETLEAAKAAEVLQKLGEALLALSRLEEAVERFLQAAVIYEQNHNRIGLGAVERWMGRVYWELGVRDSALRHYEKALALLEQEPESAELARAISAIAQMHMLADAYDEAIPWAERAIALARRLHVEDVTAHALTSLGASLVAKGEAEIGLPMLAESQARAEALGMPHDTGRAFAGWGDSLVSLERYEEAWAVYERMLVYAQKVQAGMFEGVALVQLGFLDWWQGRWGVALEWMQEIQAWMAATSGSLMAKVWASNLMGMIYNDLGQPERAVAVLTEYSEVARSADEPQTTVPHLAQLARCAATEAERAGLMREILALTDAAKYPRYETLPALRLACSWLAQTSGGAAASCQRLENAHRLMQSRQSAAALGEARGEAASVRKAWGEAVTAYRAAAENWEALHRPYDQVRALSAQCAALKHSGDEAAAQQVRQHAGSRIERLAGELADPDLKQSFLTLPHILILLKPD